MCFVFLRESKPEKQSMCVTERENERVYKFTQLWLSGEKFPVKSFSRESSPSVS